MIYIMKKTFKTIVCSALTLAVLGFSGVAPAMSAEEAPEMPQLNSGGAGDLLVAPTRVVLESRARAAEITLSNKGSKEATYRISFTYLHMQADGSYKEITKDEAKTTVNSADELLRYSPHQVVLKPGESQIVKVMVRKPEGLADGEYVSHMLFRAVPDVASGEDVEAKTTDSSQISIRLIPVYGVSIPVIVRQGELKAQAKLDNAQIANGSLSVTIKRTGTKSLYGDVIVTQGSSKNIVGQLRGVAVLAYNNERNISVPLTAATGPVTVEYREREEDGGKTLDKLELN